MKRIVLIAAAVFLTGCLLGPNYKRPTVATPPQFRDASASEKSLANLSWFDVFHDDVLKGLVETALKQNFDLRIAAERVLESRAQLGIVSSQKYPTVGANAQLDVVRGSRKGANTLYPPNYSADATFTQAGFSLGWELDVWGRIRRLTEAARADYMGTEEARRAVTTTLVADVTTQYLTLRELDLELKIALKTKDTAANGLRLTTLRKNRGVGTGLDIRQAEQFLYTATSQIASVERQIRLSENALSLLLGQDPGEIARGKAIEEIAPPPEVPAGLPSALLERRPDIRQAEQSLIAANADIGAAKAQYFPQIDLTGFLGGQSRQLLDLFTGPARQWSFVPSATVPIFTAGRIRAGVQFSEARQREAAIAYEKSIRTAFREVSDAIISYRKTAEQRAQEDLLVNALRDADRLSNLRYRGGLDSYLQVLDAERNLFQGELQLAQLRRQELLAVVQLYRALGGGWQ